MRRETVIRCLRSHDKELKKRGIRTLFLFGSVARDEAADNSDVDLLVDFDPPYTYDRYIQAKFYIEDLLGCSVDLVMRDTLKQQLQANIERDAIHVA